MLLVGALRDRLLPPALIRRSFNFSEDSMPSGVLPTQSLRHFTHRENRAIDIQVGNAVTSMLLKSTIRQVVVKLFPGQDLGLRHYAADDAFWLWLIGKRNQLLYPVTSSERMERKGVREWC